jgi:hypothetical protein
MMIRLIICIAICFCGSNIYSQRIYLNNPILFDANGQYIEVISEEDSSVVTQYIPDSSKLIKVFDLKECGEFKFLLYDTGGWLKIKGEYAESQKMIIDTVAVRKLGRGGIIYKERKAYWPYRHGTWNYFDSKGNLRLIERYDMGSLLDSRRLE